ncbi:MAG: hypothetical protein AAF229_07410 [Pseudomonadota bacterium]
MFSKDHAVSMVTAVLPSAGVDRITDAVLQAPDSSAIIWQARGTLLREHWWQRFVPPISPAKTMVHLLAPNDEVPHLVSTIVERARLHQQATGAVFSTPCDHAYFGSDFNVWPSRDDTPAAQSGHKLTENLNIIYCTVGHKLSDRVSKAAIGAGAHGPIVYYGEGRGLRDRLGWLRITKEHEQEVLMVIADESDADQVFDAMAKAGELHLPGRGFMYRMVIDRGMFHLASRVSHHHYQANMQQIINAIDHLSGHSHWRDQAVFDVGSGGRGVGIDDLAAERPLLRDQVRLSAIAPREQCPELMEFLLDSGAPGFTVTYGRFAANEQSEGIAGARVNAEYGMLRCVTNQPKAAQVCAAVESNAENAGFADVAMVTNPVPTVACYVPGGVDHRKPAPRIAA